MSSMADQPVQCSTSLDSGSGTLERSEVKMEAKEEEQKEEGSPSIKLRLGIDGKTTGKEKAVMERRKCAFTTAQLHELQLQACVFEHIAGGIPVPVHLVIPIWKSVASSFDSGIYEQYPSFVGVSPQGFDYRNILDPAERCRRTDGKKWRCSNSAIPDQKYCQQHMHRSRLRSRKPVESSQITFPDRTLSKNSNKESENLKNLSAPVRFQYMNKSSCNSSPSQETTATTDMVSSKRNFISDIASRSTAFLTATNNHKKNDCKRSKNFPNTSDKGEEKLSTSDNNVIFRSCESRINAVGSSASAAVGFSPKSVLQVLGSSSSVYRTEIELEPGRCRRTDGKKWRCRRDVIPNQKYCARHMHRGAKKHVEASHSVAIPTVVGCPSGKLKKANKVTCAAVTPSLCVSVPSNQLNRHDERSMSSSSETTISDTTINVFDSGSFS